MRAASRAGGSAGGAEQILAGLIAQALGADPRTSTTSRTPAAARRSRRCCRAARRRASPASRSSCRRSRPATLRAIAVSSPERVESCPMYRPCRGGHRRRAAELARRRRAPGHHARSRKPALEDTHRGHDRNRRLARDSEARGWGDALLVGAGVRGVRSEPELERVTQVLDDLGSGVGANVTDDTRDHRTTVNVRRELVRREDAERWRRTTRTARDHVRGRGCWSSSTRSRLPRRPRQPSAPAAVPLPVGVLLVVGAVAAGARARARLGVAAVAEHNVPAAGWTAAARHAGRAGGVRGPDPVPRVRRTPPPCSSAAAMLLGRARASGARSPTAGRRGDGLPALRRLDRHLRCQPDRGGSDMDSFSLLHRRVSPTR